MIKPEVCPICQENWLFNVAENDEWHRYLICGKFSQCQLSLIEDLSFPNTTFYIRKILEKECVLWWSSFDRVEIRAYLGSKYPSIGYLSWVPPFDITLEQYYKLMVFS